MNPELVTQGSVAVPSLSVLVCKNCDSNMWMIEAGHILRCQSCHHGFALHSNIVECSGGETSPSTIIHQWDDHYRAPSTSYSERADWWTLSAWREHLFGEASKRLTNKLVVDFGCGTAVRVASLAPIETHLYRYLGIDSSINALERARKVLSGGLFVRADLRSLRFQPDTVDVALCLGVLMYFEDYAEMLERLLKALKPGGVMLLHEQIRRTSWGELGGALFRTGKNPLPNAYSLPLHELVLQLKRHGAIIHKHLGGSPLRKVFMKFMDGTPLQFLRPSAAWFDSFWCSTVGRVIPALGAAEVQIVLQKS